MSDGSIKTLLFPITTLVSCKVLPFWRGHYANGVIAHPESITHVLLCLLGSPDGLEFLVAASLVCFGTGFGVHKVVPPAEARGIVADKLLVVNIMVLGASPDGKNVAQAPGEVKAAVGVDGL